MVGALESHPRRNFILFNPLKRRFNTSYLLERPPQSAHGLLSEGNTPFHLLKGHPRGHFMVTILGRLKVFLP